MSSSNEKENLEEKTFYQQTNPTKLIHSSSIKSKRPAQNLYIPKHMRNEEKKPTILNTSSNTTSNGDQVQTMVNRCNSPIMNDPSIIGYITDSSPNKSFTETSNTKLDDSDENLILNKLKSLNIAPNGTSPNGHYDEAKDQKPRVINGSASPVSPSPSEPTDNGHTIQGTKPECDWFDMYDDSGSSLQSNKLLKEQKSSADESKVIDYLKWEPQSEVLDEEESSHILEIYEFPVEFKNENIYSALKDIIGHVNFDLKWVDDTHCLGVFASASVASSVLKNNTNLFLKTRSLSKATVDSRRRAERLVSYLRPYKPRPQTTSFVANRLIGASLGLGGLIPKEKQKMERKKIDSARDTKRKDREIREAVWEGK